MNSAKLVEPLLEFILDLLQSFLCLGGFHNMNKPDTVIYMSPYPDGMQQGIFRHFGIIPGNEKGISAFLHKQIESSIKLHETFNNEKKLFLYFNLMSANQ